VSAADVGCLAVVPVSPAADTHLGQARVRTYKPRPRPDRAPRERRAARLRDKGLSLRQIAARLGVSHDTVWRDLARWDARQLAAAVRGVAPDPQGGGGNRSDSRPVDVVMAGSIRTETFQNTSTWITVRCGRCGHQQETGAESRTSTCKQCGRTMRLDQAAAAAPNVTPLRRRQA
jgi:ribosomal protein S27E/predicted DNA-binding protein (UPF0251 family)